MTENDQKSQILSSGNKITAFHGVFETKLAGMIKTIKKLRKDPSATSKAKIKNLLAEAKAIKKIIAKEKKNSPIHRLEVELIFSNDQEPKIIGSQSLIDISHTITNDILAIEFKIENEK